MIVIGAGRRQYLDYAPSADGHYVDVQGVLDLGPVRGLYFERQKSLRLVWNYIRDIGIGNTLLKVASRSAEKNRNKKHLLVGTGILDQEGGRKPVMFVAPAHPRYPSRLFLPIQLLHPLQTPERVPDGLTIFELPEAFDLDSQDLISPMAWSPYAGDDRVSVDWGRVRELIDAAAPVARHDIPPSPVRTRRGPKSPATMHGATLFGYGNYAKTIILPSLPKAIRVNRIHEIDPLQATGRKDCLWDTSPCLSEDDPNPVVFIAGYHSTHNGLACAALDRNKSVVVEKPLVVSRDQLDSLAVCYQRSSGKYFACFHKRYSSFNGLALEDLGVTASGEPVNYHCIVYEVPLPDRHWYLWPSSSSRIVSNGCHWIDHFLFLNGFSPPESLSARAAADGTVVVFMQLLNGACFTMTLTDIGSQRIGVQDYIELRRGGVTVKISNGAGYLSENGSRIIRRRSVNKISSYRNMYRAIGDAIVSGQQGDRWESILISSEAMLSVHESLEGASVWSQCGSMPGPGDGLKEGPHL